MHGSDDETDNEMAAPHLENTQHAPGTGSKPIKSANGSVRLRSMPCHEIQRGRYPPPNTGRQGGLDKTWPSHGSACPVLPASGFADAISLRFRLERQFCLQVHPGQGCFPDSSDRQHECRRPHVDPVLGRFGAYRPIGLAHDFVEL